ncbi:DUF3592 domain-containing protein [Roseomonas sp. HF4]|uniref:DUF3592 domain-containing protein n=1 Tax=Roseomonas sp. HF4 TaxID=2562313 RepID=UPI001484F210|nr:DUF3592 domain-containing protein [Roseomonas sp. HF4]
MMRIRTPAGTVASIGRAPRVMAWSFLLLGLGLLAGAGVAVALELRFRAGAVETDGRVVAMRVSHGTSGRSGSSSPSWTPVFAFALPDGKEIRVESGVSSSPPCCRVGDRVRVRYDPAQPSRAQMAGFLESWLVASILGGMGIIFAGVGLVVRRAVAAPGATAQGYIERALQDHALHVQAASGVQPLHVPLAGLRQEASAAGPRWVLQARWIDPRSGGARLFESEPLPFDPVPQMRQMTSVLVAFDPAQRDGPYRMDLSFLRDPRGVPPAGPVRRG